jgi:hypothetical protein
MSYLSPNLGVCQGSGISARRLLRERLTVRVIEIFTTAFRVLVTPVRPSPAHLRRAICIDEEGVNVAY